MDELQAAPAKGSALVLTRSPKLRLLTLLLFYFTQGIPLGLFALAIPGWMAVQGRSTGEIAAVVGTAMLPWSLKLINGFVIDRYTFLAMGRRRPWIIGAQSLIGLGLLVGAVTSPSASDVVLLSTIGFCVNLAVTFQDVGIDSLAIDVMEEDERARAAGIMFGAQVLGTSGSAAVSGFLLSDVGTSVAFAVAALVPLTVAIYGVAIREREGERRLPWSAGAAHAHNRHRNVDAWVPLVKGAFWAIVKPLSLLLLPILLIRAIPSGAYESFHPVLVVQYAGWGGSDYTDIMSSVGLFTGIFGLLLGGLLVDLAGARRSMTAGFAVLALLLAGMGLLHDRWDESWLLISFFVAFEIAGIIVTIATIPICMRMCSPQVAATQFTIYMALANLGRPIGAWISALTAGEGLPAPMYFVLAGLALVSALIALLVQFPDRSIATGEVADELPQGTGLAPPVD